MRYACANIGRQAEQIHAKDEVAYNRMNVDAGQ